MTRIGILLTVALCGCTKVGTQEVATPEVPEALKDCKLYEMVLHDGARPIYVMRCPQSSSAVAWDQSQGKTTVRDYTVMP